MDNLIKHITYLILRYEKVEVPGFGVFEKRHIPAKINQDDTLVPPVAKVLFYKEIQSSGKTLIASYIRQRNISKEEAINAINFEVCDLIESLKSGEKIEIGNFGALLYNAENSIEFISVPVTFYGFEEWENKEDHNKQEIKSEEAPNCLNSNEEEFLIIKIRKKFASIAAAIMLLISICGFTLFAQYGVNTINNYNISTEVYNNKKKIIKNNTGEEENKILPNLIVPSSEDEELILEDSAPELFYIG